MNPVLDSKYDCGFNPAGKPLREVVNHWRSCSDPGCRRSLQNYETMRMQYVRKFGTREQKEALLKQWHQLYDGVTLPSGKMRRRLREER